MNDPTPPPHLLAVTGVNPQNRERFKKIIRKNSEPCGDPSLASQHLGCQKKTPTHPPPGSQTYIYFFVYQQLRFKLRPLLSP